MRSQRTRPKAHRNAHYLGSPVSGFARKGVLAVKRIAFTAVLTVAVAAGFLFTRPTDAQTADNAAGKIGLIDIVHVFKEYDKVKTMLKGLAEEAKQNESALKTKVQDMQQLQKQLQAGTFAPDSPQYKQLEQKLITMSTEIESERKVRQLEFVRKESEIYKSVYVEIQDTVGMFAKHYNYDVILKFSRTKVDEASNPQQVMASMNRQVVHFDPQDDITEPILKYLNQQYAKTAGGAPAGAAK